MVITSEIASYIVNVVPAVLDAPRLSVTFRLIGFFGNPVTGSAYSRPSASISGQVKVGCEPEASS